MNASDDVLARYREVPDDVRALLWALPVNGVIVWYWSNSMNGRWPCDVWDSDPDRVLAAAAQMGHLSRAARRRDANGA